MDPVANLAIGFSATATALKISGGFESKPQKNSAGFHLTSFYALADTTVEIEGITDATIGLMSRLKGGRLRTGSDALPSALRASPVRGEDWNGATVTIAVGMSPAPGYYTVENAATPVFRRLFTASGFGAAGGAGEDVSNMFAIANVPSGLPTTAVGGFFVEPVATGEVAEYYYGSENLPDIVAAYAVTEASKNADPDGRNQARVYIPKIVLNPIEDTYQMGELYALGTVGGMGSARHRHRRNIQRGLFLRDVINLPRRGQVRRLGLTLRWQILCPTIAEYDAIAHGGLFEKLRILRRIRRAGPLARLLCAREIAADLMAQFEACAFPKSATANGAGESGIDPLIKRFALELTRSTGIIAEGPVRDADAPGMDAPARTLLLGAGAGGSVLRCNDGPGGHPRISDPARSVPARDGRSRPDASHPGGVGRNGALING